MSSLRARELVERFPVLQRVSRRLTTQTALLSAWTPLVAFLFLEMI